LLTLFSFSVAGAAMASPAVLAAHKRLPKRIFLRTCSAKDFLGKNSADMDVRASSGESKLYNADEALVLEACYIFLGRNV
jgi:hypothetical protein